MRDGMDPPATATEITDPAERARVLYEIHTRSWNIDPDQARERTRGGWSRVRW
jgi:hypothetical protein